MNLRYLLSASLLAFAFSACESSKSSSGGDDAADAADAADGTDGTAAADATDSADGTESGDGSDGTDGSTDTTDGTDGSTDSTDGTDGSDVTAPDGSDGTDGEPEELKCLGILQCVNGCPQTNQQEFQFCLEDCRSQGSSESATAFSAFLQCQFTNCADATTNEAVNACIMEKCSEEALTCQNDGLGAGDKTCPQLFTCLQPCAAISDQAEAAACQLACLEDGSKGAVDAFYAVTECAQTNCAGLEDAALEKCAEEKCAEPFEACFGGAVGTGDATCPELVACLNPCATKPNQQEAAACQLDCLTEASELAADTYDTLQTCVIDACGAQPQPACVQSSQMAEGQCQPIIAACQANEAYVPADGQFDSTDATDGTDMTDGMDAMDAMDATDGTDGVPPEMPIPAFQASFSKASFAVIALPALAMKSQPYSLSMFFRSHAK